MLTAQQQTNFDRHQGYARAVAYRYRNLLPLDDARQEALVALLEAVQAQPAPDNFQAFAGTIIARRLIDAARKYHPLKRKGLERVRQGLDPELQLTPLSSLLSDRLEGEDFADHQPDPERSAMWRELWQRCLVPLSPADRELFRLRFVLGLNVEQIGRRLHDSPATLLERLRAILAHVRATLEDEEGVSCG